MTAKRAKYPDGTRRAGPIRTAVLRGLAVVLPPLLTIVIFLWVAGTIQQYVLEPLTGLARDVIVWSIADIQTEDELPASLRGRENPVIDGVRLQQVENGGKETFVPAEVYEYVRKHRRVGRVESMPQTATGVYRRYVELKFLQPYQVIPYFLCGFILVLYLLGKFMAAGAGRFFGRAFERVIHRVPFVRKVYVSVKQVSDFLLTEPDIQYSRVVAVEWPRKGIWCLALVTGAGLKEVRAAAGEEVLSVLIPTSPMPMTGFTVTVKKSDTIDLDISIDEAIQFIVSCGVVVPAGHVKKMQAPAETAAALAAASKASESDSGDS